MKDLYAYISEAKGYLDYDSLLNDIINEIYFNDEIKNYFIERYNKAIEYASEGNGNDIVPRILYFLGKMNYIEDLSNKAIRIVSKNYPSWLNELQIILKYNEDYTGDAFIDTDLLDPNKKTGVIFIDIIRFYRNLVDSFEYFVRKKYRSFRKEDVDKLEYLVNAPMDDAYKIRIARERLGMCFPDEIIFHTEMQ
jgi:hypothetical protein